MTEIEITDDDIEAVTDPAVCRLADTIVLRNQGCGNASVLIDRFVKQVRHEARAEALEEAAKLCESYAEINMEICGDNIILDPVLRGEGFDEENMLRSEHHQNLSLIHSSKYHASTELAASLRALRSGEREG